MSSKVCKECNIATMKQHPELYWWHKCPLCGFCEFDLELIHPKNWEIAINNKYAKIPDLMVQELYKNRTIYST